MVTLAIPDAIATPFSKRHGGTARGKKTAALNLVSLGTVANMLAALYQQHVIQLIFPPANTSIYTTADDTSIYRSKKKAGKRLFSIFPDDLLRVALALAIGYATCQRY